MNYVHKKVSTPVGILTLVGSDTGLAAILWEKEKDGRVPLALGDENKTMPLFIETERQLKEYFNKKRTTFDIPLDPHGTAFQKKVWKVLTTIPFGETLSYKQVAEKIGNPKAVRAVGSAIGKNPLSIVTACHRVVSTTGTLAGFAGGLDCKVKLLELEGATFHN